ncbi:DegT/DnrJ/EryC1/StrS family aminotransferase [bacterium]|jgi:dTDP-4-amino-4,6-dideoxygalactose transaminase|nr:DegT/DnrJ/EryC1/StrS family aminotransferase [bacterium]
MNYKKRAENNLALYGGKPCRPRKKFLVFGSPAIGKEELLEIQDSIKKRWIGTGPKVARFENDFAEYKGSPFAIALNSCTAALHLSMLASGVGPGDEVITTPMTFCATINAIIHSGATPVLADCDRKTMNIDPREIEKKITKKTKAVLIVHFAGRPCDMDPIVSLCKKHNLTLIEDCAHAIESEYHGKKTGTFGQLGCFSFYVTKNIITGEGGMVITRNKEMASKIKVLALHGMSKDAWKRFADEGYKHYQVIYPGFKYNMMDIQAAMGIHQLKRIGLYWKKRKAIWERYNKELADLPCYLPLDPEPRTKHAFHLYTPLINIKKLGKTRDWALHALTAENIGVGVHYIPVHLHPYYRKHYGWKKGSFPNAEWIGERTISLPLSPALTKDDVRDVCRAFKKVLKVKK